MSFWNAVEGRRGRPSDAVTADGAAFRTSVAKVATDVVRDDAGVRGGPCYLPHCERSAGQYLLGVLLDAGSNSESGLLALTFTEGLDAVTPPDLRIARGSSCQARLADGRMGHRGHLLEPVVLPEVPGLIVGGRRHGRRCHCCCRRSLLAGYLAGRPLAGEVAGPGLKSAGAPPCPPAGNGTVTDVRPLRSTVPAVSRSPVAAGRRPPAPFAVVADGLMLDRLERHVPALPGTA